jgi:hypothetical protein
MKLRQPSLGTKAAIFLPFLISCTRAHLRMAELGCLASMPLQHSQAGWGRRSTQEDQVSAGALAGLQGCAAHFCRSSRWRAVRLTEVQSAAIPRFAAAACWLHPTQRAPSFSSKNHTAAAAPLALPPPPALGPHPSGCRSRCSGAHIFSSTMPLAWEAPANGFFHSEPRWDFL